MLLIKARCAPRDGEVKGKITERSPCVARLAAHPFFWLLVVSRQGSSSSFDLGPRPLSRVPKSTEANPLSRDRWPPYNRNRWFYIGSPRLTLPRLCPLIPGCCCPVTLNRNERSMCFHKSELIPRLEFRFSDMRFKIVKWLTSVY